MSNPNKTVDRLRAERDKLRRMLAEKIETDRIERLGAEFNRVNMPIVDKRSEPDPIMQLWLALGVAAGPCWIGPDFRG